MIPQDIVVEEAQRNMLPEALSMDVPLGYLPRGSLSKGTRLERKGGKHRLVNFQASFKAGIKVRFGLIACNGSSQVLATATDLRVYVSFPTVAQACCFRRAIELTMELVFRGVIFENDFQVLHRA